MSVVIQPDGELVYGRNLHESLDVNPPEHIIHMQYEIPVLVPHEWYIQFVKYNIVIEGIGFCMMCFLSIHFSICLIFCMISYNGYKKNKLIFKLFWHNQNLLLFCSSILLLVYTKSLIYLGLLGLKFVQLSTCISYWFKYKYI